MKPDFRDRPSDESERSFVHGHPRLVDYVPSLLLTSVMMMAWLTHLHTGMASWGVSAVAFSQGRYDTILLHIFAHGGWTHLLMNSAALIEVGGLVVAGLGGKLKAHLLFYSVFWLAGLSAMLFFLSFHKFSSVPMIGASGAIYGLVGLLLSMRMCQEFDYVEFKSVLVATAKFFQDNLLFLFLLTISGVLAGYSGGIAWEAHLGGFLFGLAFGPWIVPKVQN